VIAGFVELYLLVVLMRVIGLLYLAKKDALGWFNR
jgi:NADH:ubiquinone oxidoreductase subunit 3 (subunit A)